MTALNIRPLSLLLALLPLGCRAALVDSVDPMIGAVTYPDKDQQGRNAGDGAISMEPPSEGSASPSG